MGANRIRIRPGVAVAALAVFVLAAIVALDSTMEAVEERQSAAAAMDLRIAATTVAHADQLRGLGEEFTVTELSLAVEALSSDRELALHALGPDEALEANRLLDEISGCGILLLEPEESEHVAHGHGELQELLRSATQRSSSDAARAERNAAIALGAMSVVAAFVVWLVMRSRSRAVRARALAVAQFRAGQRLEVLLNDSPDILLVIDNENQISYRSASSSELLETASGSLEDLVNLASGRDHDSLRAHLHHAGPNGASALFELCGLGGESGWFDVRISDLTEHELVEGHLVTIRNVTNEIRLRDELQHQATTDFLTGLPNRRVLQPELDAAYLTMEAQGATMALLTLDIDGFKTINDTLGHLAGDELLVEVAARLNNATRKGETLLRLGGDEFAVIIPNVPGCAAAELTANRLLEVLDKPFRIGERTEHVRTSIGVAATSDPDHAKFLLGEADVALYEAKRLGGDKVVVFEKALSSTITRRDQITRALRQANYDDEFRIVYQPIVNAETRKISTLEALLRWTSPTLGEVTPDEFIPIAEITGEICLLGKWVFNEVCEQLAHWTDAGMDPSVSVSFNVSPRQLAEEPFVSCVLDTTNKWGVQPGQIVIEVTESAALDPTGRPQHRLEQLRSAGLRISIDDFGSGYSNLGQLLAVPFDIIKIDRSLLLTLTAMREQAGGDATGPCAIMEAIVSIASILNAPVVCEGVETEDQLASLRASGITHIQGYLTGRPSPPNQITPLLRAHHAPAADQGPSDVGQQALNQVH